MENECWNGFIRIALKVASQRTITGKRVIFKQKKKIEEKHEHKRTFQALYVTNIFQLGRHRRFTISVARKNEIILRLF